MLNSHCCQCESNKKCVIIDRKWEKHRATLLRQKLACVEDSKKLTNRSPIPIKIENGGWGGNKKYLISWYHGYRASFCAPNSFRVLRLCCNCGFFFCAKTTTKQTRKYPTFHVYTYISPIHPEALSGWLLVKLHVLSVLTLPLIP